MTLDRSKHVVVVGMMGSGKTTFGTALAKELDMVCLDSDAIINARYGRTSAELAEMDGLALLHKIEADLVQEQLDLDTPHVLLVAASVIENECCRDVMADEATVVWVVTPFDELILRMQLGDHRRAMSAAEFAERFEVRTPLFAVVADYEVDGLASPSSQVERVLR